MSYAGIRGAVLLACLLAAAPVLAQESQLHAEFRKEADALKKSCAPFSFKAVGSCAITIATESPLHAALGSIAPQNGFGFGLAFATHRTPNEHWRLGWNADAVASIGGAWRAGAYMKIVHVPTQTIGVILDPTTAPAGSAPAIHPYTVVDAYVQTTSLNTLFFFGLGPDSTLAGKTSFGMRETIAGASAIVPVTQPAALRRLNLALLGEANGRFVDLRAGDSKETPSIDALYHESRAPGLDGQPVFLQLGEGLRAAPTLVNDRLELDYLFKVQEFLSVSDSPYSFRRWTLDLQHDIPLYRDSRPQRPLDTTGPDDCAPGAGDAGCASISRNRQGTISVRLMASGSSTSSGNVVPFYFQPTLGGGDVNGNAALASYQDYRFRAPNYVLLRVGVEHSIFGPVGLSLVADQGKVADRAGDLNLRRLVHTFTAGLTLRAGGFPQATVSMAWGGPEGHHFVAAMSTSLLGGSSRPSLH
jgi:hypothetical protein